MEFFVVLGTYGHFLVGFVRFGLVLVYILLLFFFKELCPALIISSGKVNRVL